MLQLPRGGEIAVLVMSDECVHDQAPSPRAYWCKVQACDPISESQARRSSTGDLS